MFLALPFLPSFMQLNMKSTSQMADVFLPCLAEDHEL